MDPSLLARASEEHARQEVGAKRELFSPTKPLALATSVSSLAGRVCSCNVRKTQSRSRGFSASLFSVCSWALAGSLQAFASV